MADLKISQIKSLLQDRVEPLVKHLLPQARFKGKLAQVSSSGKVSGGSFVVWLKGTAPGAWKDYASGDQGDIIDLIVFAGLGQVPPFSRADRVNAIKWAKGWLGIDQIQSIDLTRAHAAALKRAEMRRQIDKSTDEIKQKRAFDMFMHAKKTLGGTLAQTYLESRAIIFDKLVSPEHLQCLERDLRFQPMLEYWMGAERDGSGRKIRSGPTFPALIAAMRDAFGGIRAVHCTFLDPSGTGKADVPTPKLMWPGTKGLVIRIGRGSSGLTPEEAAEQGHKGLCVLTEGIEDALSIVMARPDLRVWACGSLAGLASAPVLPCVSGFIVAADNDWHSEQARAGLDKAVEQLRRSAVPVSIARSLFGKDFNDALRGGCDTFLGADEFVAEIER